MNKKKRNNHQIKSKKLHPLTQFIPFPPRTFSRAANYSALSPGLSPPLLTPLSSPFAPLPFAPPLVRFSSRLGSSCSVSHQLHTCRIVLFVYSSFIIIYFFICPCFIFCYFFFYFPLFYLVYPPSVVLSLSCSLFFSHLLSLLERPLFMTALVLVFLSLSLCHLLQQQQHFLLAHSTFMHRPSLSNCREFMYLCN